MPPRVSRKRQRETISFALRSIPHEQRIHMRVTRATNIETQTGKWYINNSHNLYRESKHVSLSPSLSLSVLCTGTARKLKRMSNVVVSPKPCLIINIDVVSCGSIKKIQPNFAHERKRIVYFLATRMDPLRGFLGNVQRRFDFLKFEFTLAIRYERQAAYAQKRMQNIYNNKNMNPSQSTY